MQGASARKRGAVPRGKKSNATGPVTFSAYAKHRGVSPAAITKAVKAARLAASLTPDGKKIRNVAAADREWAASTRARVDARSSAEADDGYLKARARREQALAEIAEAEARKVTGGSWLPATRVAELERRYREFYSYVVVFLRRKLPYAISHHCDVDGVARAAEALALEQYRRPNGCRAPDGGMLRVPVTSRLVLHEVESASDAVLNELADLIAKFGVDDIDVRSLPPL